MSDIEKVVTRTRRLEKLLRTQYHADGKGMHQLITSCEERLPHDVIDKLRYIATIRNKVVHEEDFKLDSRRDFLTVCDECEKELTPRSSIHLESSNYLDDANNLGGITLLLCALGYFIEAFIA